MFNLKLDFRKILLVTLLLLFASCTPQVAPGASGAGSDESTESMQDDHGDDGHGGDGHDDEHGDEKHDDEHGDEDHGDDDHDEDGHGDEDHDDEKHGDEDHDNEKHDEDGHGDEEHREHGAHEHGTAELTVALVDGKAEISLETPAFNMVGFEYAPNTEEEIAAVDAALEVLEKAEWLTLSEAAECSLVSADVDSSMGEAEHHEEGHDEGEEEHHEGEEEGHDEDGHGDEDHDEEGETHSSFFVTYNYDCTSLENLTSLDATMLFTTFPNFEDVDAQWLNDTQQSAAVLDKDQPILSFE